MNIIKQLATELKIRPEQAEQTARLLDDGNTIPFIARYRKEATGELDETVIRDLSERLSYLRNLEERKAEVTRLIDAQEALTPELSDSIARAATLQELDDLYRPFRPKRRTRASMAKEKGLEPLASELLMQGSENPETLAAAFINDEVETSEDALQGALDIIAEQISDDPVQRALIRKFTYETGLLTSEKTKVEKNPDAKDFQMYFDYFEDVAKIPPHRILAINRGERLDILRVRIQVDVEKVLALLSKEIIENQTSPTIEYLQRAIEDGYSRLLAPSLEREIRNSLTEQAEEHAITIFAKNLRDLLMQSPVRGHGVLGIDPAFRTGCKVVAIGEFGDLLAYTTIYPHEPQKRWTEALKTLQDMAKEYNLSLITIGNGTASRETEQLVAELIKDHCPKLQYLVVNEAGASVYSASKLAKEEFPELDVSIRGAVSIARRVQDPLAELVKIDPKSIGVGQYQHDVNQKGLTNTLGQVVESCVNHVGVELNTASSALLRHVSGLSAKVADGIVDYRANNGVFQRRAELKEVKGLGPKSFQQAAGFLRIAGGTKPLDNTAVHPESYPLALQILSQIDYKEEDLLDPDTLKAIRERLKTLNPAELAKNLDAGEPTVRDILDSLGQPGRDPRDELPAPLFRADVLSMEDLRPGMSLQGTVQNVVDFGAFIDIGVEKAGLVHISELSDRYVRHPTDVVQVGDVVSVRILNVESELGRISLTMKTAH